MSAQKEDGTYDFHIALREHKSNLIQKRDLALAILRETINPELVCQAGPSFNAPSLGRTAIKRCWL